MALEQFELLAPVKISDGSDRFELRALSGVTNLSAEYAVQVETGDDLRYAMPANFDPNDWTISGWLVPDFASTDGLRHQLWSIEPNANNRIECWKEAAGSTLFVFVANGSEKNLALTKTFAAGVPVFVGVRVCGPQVTAYMDTNSDGTLETTTTQLADAYAAGSYVLRVGQDRSGAYQLEGAVNLLITDNGGSAAPITDRFNAGAGMALAGDDGWLARHGKNLVLHVGGNAAGTAIQAETYSAATDMLAGTATGRVDLAPTTDYVRFGNTAEFDGATKVSMMWELEMDAGGGNQPLFMSDSAGFASSSLAFTFDSSQYLYAQLDGGAGAIYKAFAAPLAAGTRLMLGAVLDLSLVSVARLKVYASIYDPITKRYGTWVEVNSSNAEGGAIPASLSAEAGVHQVGGGTWDGKFDGFAWIVGTAHDFTAIKPMPHEADPSKWTHWWPFDGDGVDVLAGLTATVTGGSYVDDGRHGKGSMERWTKNGARYFDGVDDEVDLGNVKALDGATSFAMLIPFKTAAPTADHALFSRWDGGSNERQVLADINNASRFIFYLSPDGTAVASGYTPALTADTWYMAWVLFNGAGATDADRLKIGLSALNEESGRWGAFAEQTLVFSATDIPAYLSTPPTSTLAYMGRSVDGDFFKGLIDDVRLWVKNVPTIAQLNACLPTDERDSMVASGCPLPDHWWTESEDAGATDYDRQYAGADITAIVRPTFARADTGTQNYASGTVRAAASGELRNKHVCGGPFAEGAYYLSGSGTTYITHGNYAALNGATKAVAEIVVKSVGTNNGLYLLERGRTGVDGGLGARINADGSVRVWVPTSATDSGTYGEIAALVVNGAGWVKIRIEYDGTLAAGNRLAVYKSTLDETVGIWSTPAAQTVTITGTIPAALQTVATNTTLYVGATAQGAASSTIVVDRFALHAGSLPATKTVYEDGSALYDIWCDYNGNARNKGLGGATYDGVVIGAVQVTDGRRYPVTLLERAYTNKMGTALVSWTPTSVVITSVVEADPAGGTTAALITVDAGAATHRIGVATAAAIGPLSGEVWLKAGTHPYAMLYWWNATDTTVNSAVVNLLTGKRITGGGTAGSAYRISAMRADGWVRVQLYGSAATVANTSIYLSPCDAAGNAYWTAAGTETIYVWRPTLYEQKVPPESVLAASEATTEDSLTTPLNLTTPQEATYLYEGVALDLPNAGTARYFLSIGGMASAGEPSLSAYWRDSAAGITFVHRGLVGSEQGNVAAAVALGDRYALRFHQAASGAVDVVGLSINGGAEVVTNNVVAAKAFAASWSQNVVAFQPPDSAANSGLISFKAQSGAEKSLATMLALAQPDIAHYHPGMQTADVDGTVTGALQWADGRIPADLTLSGVERIGRAKYLARKTFSRAGVATYYDGVDYLTRTAPAGHLRDNHSWTANDGVTYRTTSLGRAYTNLVPSDDFAAWGAGGATVATGQSDPFGGTAAFLLTGTGEWDTRTYTIPFTGDGTKAQGFYIRAGTAAESWLWLYDTSVPAYRIRVKVTWTAGVPSLSVVGGAGTLFTVQPRGFGYYYVAFNGTGVVAANTNVLSVAPGVGTMAIYRVNAFNDPIPPQDILNASEVRAADSFVDAYTALPQAATYLYEGIVADLTGQSVTRNLFYVGGGTGAQAGLRLLYHSILGRIYLQHLNGVTDDSMYWSVPALAIGDRLTIRWHQAASGAIDAVGLTINGGVEDTTLDGTGATIVLAAAWFSPTVTFAGADQDANAALTKFVAASGSKTTAEMQAMLETDAACLYLYVPGQYGSKGTYSMWMQNTGASSNAYTTATGTAGLWHLIRGDVRESVDYAGIYTEVAGAHAIPATVGNVLTDLGRGVRETAAVARVLGAYLAVGYEGATGYFDNLTWAQLPLVSPSTATKLVPSRVVASFSRPGYGYPYVLLALDNDESVVGFAKNDTNVQFGPAGGNTILSPGWHTVGLGYDGAALFVTIDAEKEATTVALTGGFINLTETTMGALRSAVVGHFLGINGDIDMGRLLIWDTPLSDAERAEAHNILRRMYYLLPEAT